MRPYTPSAPLRFSLLSYRARVAARKRWHCFILEPTWRYTK